MQGRYRRANSQGNLGNSSNTQNRGRNNQGTGNRRGANRGTQTGNGLGASPQGGAFSNYKTDSKGRTLSSGMQKYLKFSVNKDSNGRHNVLYSSADPTTPVFKPDESGLIWTTTDANIAARLGKDSNSTVKELYGQVERPLRKELILGEDLDINAISKEVKNGFFDGVIVNFKADNQNEYLNSLLKKHPDTLAEECIKNVDGHSGTALPNETIKDYMERATKSAYKYVAVLDSFQLKSVDNKKPTKNADIQYSLSEETDSQGKVLTKEQQMRYRNISPLLRDENGNIKRYYHGTARGDRVGKIGRAHV